MIAMSTANEVNLETRLPYVKFDLANTRIRQSQFKYQPDWRWEYVELLRRREYRAAQRLREQQALRVLRERG